MWRGGWIIGSVACGCGLVLAGGCVSLDDHNRLKASHRTVLAEKEHVAQELYDARQVNDSLRTRVGSVERELEVKEELLGNLRTENELLDKMQRMAEAELEKLASKMELGDIVITGPKLPAPLDSALKDFANEHPGSVIYDPAAGTVKWNADVLFALGSDVVKDSSKDLLRRFSEIIKSPAAADFEVLVVGHTDTRRIAKQETKAKHPTNWHLSSHRAISVARLLLASGYLPERTGVMGYGEYRPVADNATEEGAGQNRRVEIYLIPAGSIVQAARDRRVEGESLAATHLTR